MGLFLYLNQRNLLYFHTPDKVTNYHKMTMQNDGESINIIVLNAGHKNAILYFGGNAESMVGSADYVAGQFPEFTVYLMDYRGYGASTGVSTEKALYRDALKMYDKVMSKHKSISVGGRSLGSGVATYVAAHRKVSKLALITPYDSIVNVAQSMYPLYPVKLLVSDVYDSVGRVKDIRAKTLIIFAENDTVIPRENTENLINAFDSNNLEVIMIKERGHNNISSDEIYYKSMQDFIGES
jgi:esterase/lipase